MNELEYSDLVDYIHSRIEELDEEVPVDLISFILECEADFLEANGYDLYEEEEE